MNNELKEIEVKSLVTVKGKSGLWKIRKILANSRMYNLINIVTEEIKTFPSKNIIPINLYTIYSNKKDKSEYSIEEIFETLEKLKESDYNIPNSKDFKSLKESVKDEFMEKIVPEYSEVFKDYHAEKILKWFENLSLYLEKLDKEIDDETI